MTETNTQISVYDALLDDNPTILATVQNATGKLLTQVFAFSNKRAAVEYMQAIRALVDELGFPPAGKYVFLNKSPAELDNIFGSRQDGSLLDELPEGTCRHITTALDDLAVVGAQIANYTPRVTYALALADLEADLERVAP
jgi:hypothetical protein